MTVPPPSAGSSAVSSAAASAVLVRDLQGRVRALEDDLRRQVAALPELDASLREEHAEAHRRERTAEPWDAWLDAQVTQAAVAWVLGCVFVRFCEDNGLTSHRWIAGLADEHGDGLARAVDAQAAWIEKHPRDNERGWLREAFRWLASTKAGAGLVDRHNPVWRWDVSADAAADLLAFFRRRGDGGRDLAYRFDSPEWDTRLLGDLYQDLSEAARKRYALLQTPPFVEEFILDRTLDPAVEEFGPDGFRMIDPTCGSGHFLLGAFRRLFDARTREAPGTDVRERVQAALDSVWGVDLNPFAAAIARFRLMVAALRACEASRLDGPDAPAFSLHIAVGDSLLYQQGHQGEFDFEGLASHQYVTEDLGEHPDILRPGRYHVVVGNPPYITVKDRALNAAYRNAYGSCHRQYALSVPFAELFFKLAVYDHERPGYAGQITANSFMKREFGKKLIEDYFPTVDLTHVIDTSGAYIPGHGTPTVILTGRRRYPRTDSVRAVLGIRGEPGVPPDPAKGLVWTSIAENVDLPGTETEYVSVVDLPRDRLAGHPWSLSGGGAPDLFALMESAATDRVGKRVTTIGRVTHTGSDEAYFAPSGTWRRQQVRATSVVPVVEGDTVRDWRIQLETEALFPYDGSYSASLHDEFVARSLWLAKPYLRQRREPGGTHEEIGLTWFEWSRWHPERFAVPLGIGMSFVATHNHFVLDRGGKVFKQSAPVIKLPEGAGEEEHLRLLGLLNSSAACFWLKQVSHDKGVGGIGGGIGDEDWEPRFEFTGTKLAEFPLSHGAPLDKARRLDSLAQEIAAVTPQAVCAEGVPTREALERARERWGAVRAEMIAVQEELDWEVYRLYGIVDDDLTYPGGDLPGLALGERAFEIVLARRAAAGETDTEWFTRHRSAPITEIQQRWPEPYRDLVRRRIEAIETHPLLHLIERPECKRRWATRAWDDMRADALAGWLLDRLEAEELWRDRHGPRVLSVAQLADLVRGDADLRAVLDLYLGRPDYDLAKEIGRLVRDEAVPYLAAWRYKPSGLRKRAAWEETWRLQRLEDTGEHAEPIPVPPKYTNADFRATSYWKHRGKLDVPKERYVSYPKTEREGDKMAVLGWAGWDHLAKAQGLARLVLDRSQHDGWDGDRLRPLLAGLAELEPWLHQWHTASDPLYGGSPADFHTAFLDEQCRAAGLTRDQLADWHP